MRSDRVASNYDARFAQDFYWAHFSRPEARSLRTPPPEVLEVVRDKWYYSDIVEFFEVRNGSRSPGARDPPPCPDGKTLGNR